ncbi:mitotic-spindle disanchored Msd1 [Schizosaccharomyces octosporus yFS286]|uniref:Mitotic-spindle disanchored Msd1 n=1 Tax=Schizosaccharomyces octosporus (strain yFS286) TaxID=483514 RepID=S9PWU4_SCHOY|nr:mitotic-spindle disanchored Msd1 [Schizosaccharomyces octosporus yFS286]EPX72462.1 mitotic-spindle disanchored Msd1 [Schizosaccharomyces octosporus yFS286]
MATNVFCDSTNLKESIQYVNYKLKDKGILQNEKVHFSDDVKDKCRIVNVLYQLLRRNEADVQEKENLLERIQNDSIESVKNLELSKQLQRNLDKSLNERQAREDRILMLEKENKKLRKENKDIMNALDKKKHIEAAMKAELSMSLKKREQQMESLRGNYDSIKRRKGNNSYCSLIIKEPQKSHVNAPILPETHDTEEHELKKVSEHEDYLGVSLFLQNIKNQNHKLQRCLNDSVTSLETLLRPLYKSYPDSLITCFEQNAVVLDAKLQNLIRLVAEVLNQEKYVSVRDLESLTVELENSMKYTKNLEEENKKLIDGLAHGYALISGQLDYKQPINKGQKADLLEKRTIP